eukprot:4473503-Pyramimonas_sp.AAC.2
MSSAVKVALPVAFLPIANTHVNPPMPTTFVEGSARRPASQEGGGGMAAASSGRSASASAREIGFGVVTCEGGQEGVKKGSRGGQEGVERGSKGGLNVVPPPCK